MAMNKLRLQSEVKTSLSEVISFHPRRQTLAYSLRQID